MEVNVTGTQFEDVNALRKYPFAESASCVDDAGFELESGILTDALVVVFSSIDSPYFSYVHVGDSLLSVVLSDSKGAVATLTVNGYSNNREYRMESVRSGINVIVSVGNLSRYKGITHRFSSAGQARLHDFCVIEIPGSIVDCVVDDTSGEKFTGTISFVFSGGIGASADQSGNILLSASDSIEKTLSGGCTPTDLNKSCIVPVIQSICGVKPNDFGEIALVLE